VSHQIRRLEEQVGQPLIRRTTRSLTLTHDGEDFLHHARGILTGLDALAQRFHPSPVTGVVRFGTPEAFMGERLPALLCRFSRAFPAVRLDVHVSTYLDLSTMIAAEELDIAVVLSTAGGQDGGSKLRRADFVWVAADSFALPAGSSLPLAFHPPNCVNRLIGVAALEATERDWHIAFTSASEQGLRMAVRSGLAVAVLTRSDVEPGMRVLDGEYSLPSLPSADFMLIRGRGAASPAARAFGDMISESETSTSP
jgi:DNA-binding transcriptional LysR family regulator